MRFSSTSQVSLEQVRVADNSRWALSLPMVASVDLGIHEDSFASSSEHNQQERRREWRSQGGGRANDTISDSGDDDDGVHWWRPLLALRVLQRGRRQTRAQRKQLAPPPVSP